MSARLAPSSRPLPSLFVAFLFLFVFPRPSPPWVINVIIIESNKKGHLLHTELDARLPAARPHA